MNFNFRPSMENPNHPYPPHFLPDPHHPTFSLITQQAIRVGSRISDPRAHRFGYPADPRDMPGSLQRELEKERIRAEIIAEDIMRRRILEEEVRREMMLERALTIRRGGFVGGGSSLPPMPPLLTDFKHSGRFGDQVSPITDVENRDGSEPLPFQRDPVVAGSGSGVRLQEIEVKGVVAPTSEVGQDKVIVLAKPSTNLADIKRKAMAPTASGVAVAVKKQKTQEDWSCALCRVTTTSEEGLKEHLRGKKHLARQRAMVAQRVGFGTGPLPKTTATNRGKSSRVPSLPSSASLGKAGEIDPESSFIAVDDPEPKQKGGKTKDAKPKKKLRFFCELCQVGAHSEKVLNRHKAGKRHLAKISKANRKDKPAIE